MIDFTRLNLRDYTLPEVNTEILSEEKKRTPKRKRTSRCNTMEHFENLRREKELIKTYESWKHDWRQDLMEEHPYVSIMPSTLEKEIELAKKLKKEMGSEKKTDK